MIETQRLKLRRFTLSDAPFVLELMNQPGWLKYIGDRQIGSIEAARDYLTNGPMQSYRVNGFGLNLVELKHNGSPVGMCGLLKRPELDAPDLGYAISADCYRQGYALEAATATLQFAKDNLAVKRLLAVTALDNQASIAMLNKLAFKFERLITMADQPEASRIFTREIVREKL